MIAKLTLSLFLLAVSILAINAQKVHTPEKGSAERKAILDALRAPVERELKQPVVFAADHFNVQGNWAFIDGRSQTPDGKEPNFRITKYADAIKYGAFDNNFFGLAKRTGSTWKVVTWAIGCTDVCYVDWWRRYRAPKAIFPYTE
ncbi:MAG TPA: hypothetical protein VHL50_02830 [Pyrinomonadaceae bacterium]|jgi:hypothetical protein|nr:hypothetical protein [Pyrinomonadaceae bacterium]